MLFICFHHCRCKKKKEKKKSPIYNQQVVLKKATQKTNLSVKIPIHPDRGYSRHVESKVKFDLVLVTRYKKSKEVVFFHFWLTGGCSTSCGVLVKAVDVTWSVSARGGCDDSHESHLREGMRGDRCRCGIKWWCGRPPPLRDSFFSATTQTASFTFNTQNTFKVRVTLHSASLNNRHDRHKPSVSVALIRTPVRVSRN